jgi:hypothetical protein
LFESNETVILQLRNLPPARVLLGSRSQATLVIVNDDQRVRFATTVFSVAEGSVGQMVVVREGRPNGTTTVRYAVIGGTASQGPDYKLPTAPDVWSRGDVPGRLRPDCARRGL